MKDLTKRQRMALDYIIKRIEEVGYPPTIREIGEHMGISSTNGVSDHLRALVRKGYLIRDESKSRALRPIPGKTRHMRKRKSGVDGSLSVPILGRIAAGEPILAEENVEDYIQVDPSFLGRTSKDVFALKVRGDSMIGDGILNGDLIFVRKQKVAKRGEIVAAMIDNEATVKRFFPHDDEVHLLPSNPSMEPIIVSREAFRDTQLLGVVIGVYRKLD